MSADKRSELCRAMLQARVNMLASMEQTRVRTIRIARRWRGTIGRTYRNQVDSGRHVRHSAAGVMRCRMRQREITRPYN